MTQEINIMLVEDNPEYRHVINFSLEDDTILQLTSQFGTAEQALSNIQKTPSESLPDVILLDLHLPGISGIDALPEIAKMSPQSKVIVLTQSEKEADVLAAIKYGANGYLLKSASIQEIKSGIHNVMEGGASVDPKMASFILNSCKEVDESPEESSPLSEREIEILALISHGLARKEIGDKLNISHKTVANHIAHIFEKLNVPNSPAAVSKAYRSGLFSTRKQ